MDWFYVLFAIAVILFYVGGVSVLMHDWRQREFRNENVRQLWMLAILSGVGGIFYWLRIYTKRGSSS